TSWTVTESVLWLTVSPMSGSNNGTLTVNYDANPTTSSRTGQITVTAGGGSPAVTVTVTQSGLQVCLPPWQPVTNLQYNMQVIGQIFIDGSLSGNSDDFVGAFVGNECRGMASPDPTSGLVFLTIGSNTASGDQLLFKVWRSDQCSECPTSAQMTFQNQLLVGTPSEPFAFNCGLEELNLSFGQGYTWFSVNVNPGSMAVSSLFANLNPCQNNRIIGQSSFALYFNGTWMGSLTSISPSQMYKMELCSQQDITIQGLGVPISPINLGAGYTWLGYLPQDCLGTNIAFNGLSPAPAVNNRIIGQTNFAIFFGGSWMGSLTQLCPGKGYVTELSSNSILTYPASSKNYINESPETLISPSGIIPNTATKQHNMNIVAQVLNPEGEILDATGLELIAFIGDECRGVIATDSYSDGLLFLTVGSDFEAGELIHFKVWLPETDQMMDIKETILFEAYRLLGNPAEPFTLSTYGLTGTTDLNENSTFFSEPYPNPFTHETIIDYSISKPAKISLTVFDGLGQKINYQEIYNKEKGKFQLILQRNDLKAGIYHYRIVVKNDLDQIHKTGKLIVW
ncbi:MAG: BACON domain-containing carbohydrate-binding protein, partial [Bacteroidales bacterium]|nr:BACON domain-containing carbohydrate-binding protein [Bacteroidales bacterium]